MIRWGFIGCGDVVEHKSGRPFWVDGESQVTAVMCRNLDTAKDFASRHGIPEAYNDVEKIIQHPAIDAVYIATPPSTHMPYAKMALEAGKGVYVEKPMGTTYTDCEEVVQLAKDKGLPLFVAYYRRALPYYIHVKNMMEDGTIGNIRGVSVLHYMPPLPDTDTAWKRDPVISGGGLFYDVSCHALDTLDFLFGPIASVHGDSRNLRQRTPCDDTVTCQFTFESGLMGTGFWCFDAGTYLEQIQIIGDAGEITFHIHSDVIDMTVNGEHQHLQIQHPAYIQEPMIHNVIDCLNGKAEALSTGVSALRTANVMEIVAKG